jgi:nucleoside-diphosphate-sugar epimerase
VKTEADPLDPSPPPEFRETVAALRHLEAAVLGARWTDGIVLRYGVFYGPGPSLAQGEEQFEMVRKRKFPVVGDGGGVWSFVHIADAAEATVAAIEHGTRGRLQRGRRRSRAGRRVAALRSPGRSARRSRCAYRGSSGGCSPARPAWR